MRKICIRVRIINIRVRIINIMGGAGCFSEAFRMLRIGASWFSSVEGVPDGVRRCIFHGRGTMGNHETEIPRGGGSFARQGRILSGKERDRLGKDVVKCVLRSSEMQMRPPFLD